MSISFLDPDSGYSRLRWGFLIYDFKPTVVIPELHDCSVIEPLGWVSYGSGRCRRCTEAASNGRQHIPGEFPGISGLHSLDRP